MSDTDDTTAIDEGRLARLTKRLDRFERTAHRQRLLNIALSAVLVVAASGWWLTSRDQSATRQNGKVADCRSLELAITLDAFRVIVAPGSSTADTDKAAADLEAAGPLVDRYAECNADPDHPPSQPGD